MRLRTEHRSLSFQRHLRHVIRNSIGAIRGRSNAIFGCYAVRVAYVFFFWDGTDCFHASRRWCTVNKFYLFQSPLRCLYIQKVVIGDGLNFEQSEMYSSGISPNVQLNEISVAAFTSYKALGFLFYFVEEVSNKPGNTKRAFCFLFGDRQANPFCSVLLVFNYTFRSSVKLYQFFWDSDILYRVIHSVSSNPTLFKSHLVSLHKVRSVMEGVSHKLRININDLGTENPNFESERKKARPHTGTW